MCMAGEGTPLRVPLETDSLPPPLRTVLALAHVSVDRWELTARITDAQTKEDYGRYSIDAGDVGDALAAFTVRSLVAAQSADAIAGSQLR